MNEAAFHQQAVYSMMGLGVFVFASLLFIDAPYGRHLRPGWGPTLSNRVGWILMESPTLLVFLPIYWSGTHAHELVPLVFLGFWLSHYVHRTLIYPFRLRSSGKRVPLLIALLGFLFNSVNAYLIARGLSELSTYDKSWLTSPQFIVGALVFAAGYAMNRSADRALLRLKSESEGGYRIPEGQLFRFISCPNYLGEIIQWFGFAVLTWSMPVLAFAWYTTANLAPRALSHHRFYRSEFPDYPKQRKALLPFVL